jgi:hypothetical protein
VFGLFSLFSSVAKAAPSANVVKQVVGFATAESKRVAVLAQKSTKFAAAGNAVAAQRYATAAATKAARVAKATENLSKRLP